MSDTEDDTIIDDDAAYLRDLAERLMHIPVMYGTDSYDIDRLFQIARGLSAPTAEKEEAAE